VHRLELVRAKTRIGPGEGLQVVGSGRGHGVPKVVSGPVVPAPSEILEAMHALSGAHEGHRAAHARGSLLAGTFTASRDAATVSRAAHFSGDPVRVTVRFSNGSGNPEDPDGHRLEGRGLATKFYLPDDTTTDIVALTLPVFFVRTAADVLAFLKARVPDPETGHPDGEKIGAFLAAHPETQQALGLILPSLGAPDSYATCTYNSLHAFNFVDADGAKRAGRYRWVPEAEGRMLDEDESRERSWDYLQADLRERLEEGPVVFRLWVRLAEDGDPLDDPTQPWPEERQSVELGRLAIEGFETTRERDGDVLVFDPTRVTDGIELTDDEILRTRADVYAESVLFRSGVRRS
jgi:catalase